MGGGTPAKNGQTTRGAASAVATPDPVHVGYVPTRVDTPSTHE